MVGEPNGCIRPVGRVELRTQSPVRSEQTRAEATPDIDVDVATHSDERCDAQPLEVQAICTRVLRELFDSAHPRAPSLYALLDARLRACQPERGDLRALAPCAEVNRALGRLVAIIQGEYVAHTDAAWPKRELEQAVRVALLQRIQSQPRLRARAHRLRSCAGLAETAMEQHYSRALLAQLTLQRKPFALQPTGAMRTALLERCLVNFPYTRNYRLLTTSELRLLKHPAPPLLLRAAHLVSLSSAQRQRLEAELAQLRRLAAHRPEQDTPWHKQTIAVCGAGPLPVTGLMLHTLTGARVSLIERDETAVAMSRALVEQLERLQVVDVGAVQVIHADVADLTPRAEVVLVASLVDNAAKLELSQRLRDAGSAYGFRALLLRSASSLCAELAYEPVETLQFSDPSLVFCGESVPATDVVHRAERLVSSAREVLNDTELYRPVQLCGVPPGSVHWLRDLIAQLRAVHRKDVS